MKQLNSYINEKLVINKDIKSPYKYHPKDWDELRKIIEKRLKKDKDADLNDIDVSNIKSMYKYIIIHKNNYRKQFGLFEKLDPHNIDISKWDVSNVENFNHMFYGCKNFNCDLSNWNVSNAKDMSQMFEYCYNFTGEGLENWKVSKVKDMYAMFTECKSLKNKPSWYKK